MNGLAIVTRFRHFGAGGRIEIVAGTFAGHPLRSARREQKRFGRISMPGEPQALNSSLIRQYPRRSERLSLGHHSGDRSGASPETFRLTSAGEPEYSY